MMCRDLGPMHRKKWRIFLVFAPFFAAHLYEGYSLVKACVPCLFFLYNDDICRACYYFLNEWWKFYVTKWKVCRERREINFWIFRKTALAKNLFAMSGFFARLVCSRTASSGGLLVSANIGERCGIRLYCILYYSQIWVADPRPGLTRVRIRR